MKDRETDKAQTKRDGEAEAHRNPERVSDRCRETKRDKRGAVCVFPFVAVSPTNSLHSRGTDPFVWRIKTHDNAFVNQMRMVRRSQGAACHRAHLQQARFGDQTREKEKRETKGREDERRGKRDDETSKDDEKRRTREQEKREGENKRKRKEGKKKREEQEKIED